MSIKYKEFGHMEDANRYLYGKPAPPLPFNWRLWFGLGIGIVITFLVAFAVGWGIGELVSYLHSALHKGWI